MKLYELDASDVEMAYYNPNDDKINGARLGDTRKKKLTLKAINRLKKIRAMRKLEDLQHEDLLGIMYGIPEEESGMGGGMGGGMGF